MSVKCPKCEFRAKLSEIAFSPDPHLVVAESILEEGTANRKVIEVIVNWMQENKEHIKNYDFKKPALLQLMNVTKDQLQEAVRSVDPFYQTYKSNEKYFVSQILIEFSTILFII
jgi:hypothetical protein